MVSVLPFTVAVVVLTTALELLAVVAVAAGVLLLELPELVEPPQAAIAIVSNRTTVIRKVCLR